MDQQDVNCLNTSNQDVQQYTVSQFEDQQPILQESTTNQQAMVQQVDRHSAVTISPTSMLCGPIRVHSSVQLTGCIQHQSSSSACVSSRATISTIQQSCSFLQSNSIQSSNSTYVHPVSVTGNTNVISALPNQTLIFQSHASPSVTSAVQLSPQPNTNPFYVKFIVGNTLITSQKEQPAHYHLNLSCIRAVAPTFVPSSLIVPPDIGSKLNVVHKEYLHLIFNVTVN